MYNKPDNFKPCIEFMVFGINPKIMKNKLNIVFVERFNAFSSALCSCLMYYIVLLFNVCSWSVNII